LKGVPKVVKFGFYPSKLKKQPVFANDFNIQEGALAPPAPHPTPMMRGPINRSQRFTSILQAPVMFGKIAWPSSV